MKNLLDWLYSDENTDIDRLEESEKLNQQSAKKIAAVDISSNVTYAILVGSALDYLSGLNLTGIATSRASGTVVNLFAGAPYGWWREKSYKLTRTTKDSTKLRKYVADLLAFNTFQVPVYGAIVAFSSLVSEGKMDFEKLPAEQFTWQHLLR